MDKMTKSVIDIARISLEIEGREKAIERYNQDCLDRNKAIWMIKSLRCTDPIVMYTMTAMNITQPVSGSRVSLEEGTNEELINEINWQLDVLRLERDGKTADEIVDNMSIKWRRI